MVNSDHGEVLLRPLVEAVARAEGWWDILLRPRRADPGADLDPYCGRYQLPDGQLLRIQRQADSLVLIPPGQDAVSLFPTSEDHWSARSLNATVTIAYDRDPTPARLVLHQEAMYVRTSKHCGRHRLMPLQAARPPLASPSVRHALRIHRHPLANCEAHGWSCLGPRLPCRGG